MERQNVLAECLYEAIRPKTCPNGLLLLMVVTLWSCFSGEVKSKGYLLDVHRCLVWNRGSLTPGYSREATLKAKQYIGSRWTDMALVEEKLSIFFRKPVQLFSGGKASLSANHIPEEAWRNWNIGFEWQPSSLLTSESE